MSSRARRRETGRNRAQQSDQKPQKRPKKLIWQWIGLLSPTGKLSAAVGLFLAIVGAYYAFSPKLSINPSNSLNPTNPFATLFVVRNDSLLPINSIELKCKFGKIVLENDATLLGTKEAGFKTDIPPIPKLAAGEESTFLLPYPPNFSPPVKFADVSAEVTYSPALLPFKKKALKRFVTVRAADGTFHWISKALSE